MIYLDTHVVVWLYQKDTGRFSPETQALINKEDLRISPMVELELEFLFEIDRITVNAATILDYLEERTGLKLSDKSFSRTIQKSIDVKWTRDPFDRIIVTQAMLEDSILVTKDKNIRKHYSKTVW